MLKGFILLADFKRRRSGITVLTYVGYCYALTLIVAVSYWLLR